MKERWREKKERKTKSQAQERERERERENYKSGSKELYLVGCGEVELKVIFFLVVCWD